MDDRALRRWSGWFLQGLIISVVLWLVTGAILGIPHGPGHSIEDFGAFDGPLRTVNGIAFPVWVGCLAGVLGLAASTGLRHLERLGHGTNGTSQQGV